MPSSSSFTGIGLKLQSVTPLTGAATLRVRFTNDPLASSAVGANDGLNPGNYGIVGPLGRTVTGCSVVPDDPQSIDITLGAPLITGTWTLNVANITTVTGDPLTAPTSLSFDVTVTATGEPVSMGAVNDSAESVIRKHLNPSMTGKFWDGIIAALAVGDRLNWENAKLAFNQLFLSSASGHYLDRKASDNGIIRPEAVGMGDELFRKFSIKTTANKITAQVLYEILEIFYGTDTVRAHVTTETGEGFSVSEGDDLNFIFDEKDAVKVVFASADFANPSSATALEVASVIIRFCRAQGLKAYAVAFTDPETGSKKIRVYTASLGLGGSIRVTGGKAQNALRFPSVLLTNGASAGVVAAGSWSVTVPSNGVMRLTHSGATTVDLMKVRIGDYVNVYGSNFVTDNRGSFSITAVDVRYVGGTLTQYLEVENLTATAQSPVVMATTNDLLFFRPARQNINGPRAVIVAQPRVDLLNIILPATTQAVQRKARAAAYMQARPAVTAAALERIGKTVKVTTTAIHGLSAGEWVDIDAVQPQTSFPTIVAGNGTTTSSACPVSIWSALDAMPGSPTSAPESVLLNDGRMFVAGGSAAAVPQTVARLFDVSTITDLTGGGKQLTYGWTAAAVIPQARVDHRMTVLRDSNQDGNVLLTGGENGGGAANTGYIYKPGLNSWTGSIAMIAARKQHAQVRLDDNRVLLAGGRSAKTAEIYTPDAGLGAFAAATSMGVERADFPAMKLSDGRVLAIGGNIEKDAIAAQAHVVDADTEGMWRLDEALASDAAVDASGNARTLAVSAAGGPPVTAGLIGSGRQIRSSVAKAFIAVADTPFVDMCKSGKLTWQSWVKPVAGGVDGVLFMVNGESFSFDNADAVLLEITLNADGSFGWIQWHDEDETTPTHGPRVPLDFNKWYHLAVTRTERDSDGNHRYDTFVNGVRRTSATCAGLTDTCLALIGTKPQYIGLGCYRDITGPTTANGMPNCDLDDTRVDSVIRSDAEIFDSYQRGIGYAVATQSTQTCEIYDPGANTWTQTGPMAFRRRGHRAVALGDDQVMVIGGKGGPANRPEIDEILTEAEIFDGRTGTWRPAGPTSVARWNAGALLLSSGKVLVFGGADTGVCEYFDPRSGAWTRAPHELSATRSKFAYGLVDGCAVLAGGEDSIGTAVNKSFVFIPNSDTFSGKVQGRYKLTTAFLDQLEFSTLESGYMKAANQPQITPVTAKASTTPGPFLLDPDEGVSVTATVTATTQALNANSRQTTLKVADASQFPDAEGYLVLAFGSSKQTGPVKYLGRLSATELLLDYGFKFPLTLAAGATVTLLDGKGPYAPSSSTGIGAFYLTGSSAGRVAASDAIDASVASGVNVDKTIKYPGDRGLGGEGLPAEGAEKLSDKVAVWGGDDLDAEIAAAREGDV